MTAFNLKPTFSDREGYLGWRRSWAKVQARMTHDTRDLKRRVALAHSELARLNASHLSGRQDLTEAEIIAWRRYYEAHTAASLLSKDLDLARSMARKVMMLLEEAKLRRDRILKMHEDIRLQNKDFPLDLGACKNIDFQYNAGQRDFPFLPMWIIRVKGRSYYVREVEAECAWRTHERPSGMTRGVLRFNRAHVSFTADGVARLLAAEAGVDEEREAA